MKNQELHPRTAVINKSQKNKSKIARLQALAWLAKEFPKAFNNTTAIHPLKSGIMQDILVYVDKAEAEGISKSKLREAVVVFTRRVDYLTCLKAGGMRIDLEGQPIEAVSEEDAEKAAQKIRKKVEKSIKNARKNISYKASPANSAKAGFISGNSSPPRMVMSSANKTEDSFLPVYPARQLMNTSTTNQPAKAETVVIKKVARPFDPDAVARLKAKLGISKKMEEQEVLG